MGNKSKRPGGIGKTSELVAASNQTAMAAIAVLVDAMGGRLQVSYTDLMVIADKVNLEVTTTDTHVVYTITLKPQIARPGLIVPEGPAGIADLGRPDVVIRDDPPDALELHEAVEEGRMLSDDEVTICEAFVDGGQCGREFPDHVAWQEHYEAEHPDPEG